MGPITLSALFGLGGAALMDLCTPVVVYKVMGSRKERGSALEKLRTEECGYESFFRKNKKLDR